MKLTSIMRRNKRRVRLGKGCGFGRACVRNQDIDRLARGGFSHRRVNRIRIGDVGDGGKLRGALRDQFIKRGTLAAERGDDGAGLVDCAAISRPMPRAAPVTTACGECGSLVTRHLPE